MTVIFALLAALLLHPAPALADGRDDLCSATNNSAGCIGSPTWHQEQPTYREPREPKCDEACRERAAENYRYALDHMVEPAPVQPVGSDLGERFSKRIEKIAAEDEKTDKAMPACTIVIGARRVPGLGEVAAIFGAAVLLPRAMAALVQLFAADLSAASDAAASDEACEGVTHAICDDIADCNDARRARDKTESCKNARIARGASRFERAYAKKAHDLCEGKFQSLKADVKEQFPVRSLCDDKAANPRKCDEVDPSSCDELKRRLLNATNCVNARKEVSKRCFDGAPDPFDHPGAQADAEDLEKTCLEAVAKCP